MPIDVRLAEMSEETSYAPLGVMGYCLSRSGFLSPVFADLKIPLKKVNHSVSEKLTDILVSILTGCRSVSQVNTRMRPDLALAKAWGRDRFGEQSTLTRTLDAFTDENIAQLRQGS